MIDKIKKYPLYFFGALVLVIVLIWLVTDCKREPKTTLPPTPVDSVRTSPSHAEIADEKEWERLKKLQP